MKEIIEQYGRIFLITVVMILIMLFLPGLIKQVDDFGSSSVSKQRDSSKDTYEFKIDGKTYEIPNGMSWKEWVESAKYNRDGKFSIVNYCGEEYLVYTEETTTERIENE